MEAKMVREFVEISGCSTIGALIAQLDQVRRSIPPGSSEEQVRLRGDDDFGRHILVTYSRPETREEIEAARRAEQFETTWCSRKSVVELRTRRLSGHS